MKLEEEDDQLFLKMSKEDINNLAAYFDKVIYVNNIKFFSVPEKETAKKFFELIKLARSKGGDDI